MDQAFEQTVNGILRPHDLPLGKSLRSFAFCLHWQVQRILSCFHRRCQAACSEVWRPYATRTLRGPLKWCIASTPPLDVFLQGKSCTLCQGLRSVLKQPVAFFPGP